MANRTVTITVTLNADDDTLAIAVTRPGMPMNRMAEGMILALEGQILAEIAMRVDGTEPTEQLRHTFALPIRAQVQQMLNEAPMVDTSGRRGVMTTIAKGAPPSARTAY